MFAKMTLVEEAASLMRMTSTDSVTRRAGGVYAWLMTWRAGATPASSHQCHPTARLT